MTFQQRFGASVLLLIFSLFLLPLPALAEQASGTRAQTLTAERPADPAPSGLRLADPRVLEQLRRQDAANPGLPRHLTARERRQWQPSDLTLPAPEDIPDYRFLRPQAEYERNDAILMRWGNFSTELTSMIVPITTGDSQARVILIVSGQSQQNSAANFLDAAGANLDRIDFLQFPTNDVWIRDYGPRFASANFRPIIIDHDYDRPRPLDNQVPGQVANALNLPIYELPLAQGGGNYHSFANGEAFMTDTIFHFNPSASAAQVKNLFAAYQGVDMTILGTLGQGINGGFSFPWFDGTGHLDMWFMPVDDNTVVIGEYSPTEWNGIPHEVTEEAATLMQERGYTVLRTPGWRGTAPACFNPSATTQAHYTFTNAVIVNDIVLTCEFDGYPSQNAAAQAVFETAFPDRTVVPVDCTGIIGCSGALHCIVKHKPASDAFGARPPYYDWGR